jgi:hypothetical protein
VIYQQKAAAGKIGRVYSVTLRIKTRNFYMKNQFEAFSTPHDPVKPELLDSAFTGMIPQETLSLRRLFFSFLLLGSTAFGGPAILRHMKEFTVKDRRSWGLFMTRNHYHQYRH